MVLRSILLLLLRHLVGGIGIGLADLGRRRLVVGVGRRFGLVGVVGSVRVEGSRLRVVGFGFGARSRRLVVEDRRGRRILTF